MADEKDEDVNDVVEEGYEDEESEDGEDGAEGEKQSSKIRLILFILVPVVLIFGGGAAAYFTGALDSLLGVEAPVEGELAEGEGDAHGAAGGKEADSHGKVAGGHGGGEGDDSQSSFVAIPPMLVNLNTEDETPRFLRLTVQLELKNSADHDAVQAVLPRVIDQFQTYLRELRVRDLRGSAGIYRLQIELLWRVNKAVEPIEIKDVLFQEILIQ
ncbi:MAG: flagellar basal body-associated FliL family protein [Alphaproteobacteria bacterium]|nr:flagellar basal body-associated FliL family protein [Alphaproteobacteria bacterium]